MILDTLHATVFGRGLGLNRHSCGIYMICCKCSLYGSTRCHCALHEGSHKMSLHEESHVLKTTNYIQLALFALVNYICLVAACKETSLTWYVLLQLSKNTVVSLNYSHFLIHPAVKPIVFTYQLGHTWRAASVSYMSRYMGFPPLITAGLAVWFGLWRLYF